MIIYDLSHELDEDTQVYPGDPTFACHSAANVKEHGYNVSSISIGSHTGTHIDAPYHFYDNGEAVDKLAVDMLVGPAVVVDLTKKKEREKITWDDLIDLEITHVMDECHILILHTGWSKYWKTGTYFEHPYLDAAAARKLVEIGVRVLALDTLSPDQTMMDGSEGDYSAHEVILGAGGAIVENLTNLHQLPSDRVHVSLLPLKLRGCDGSPIRAVAWPSAESPRN